MKNKASAFFKQIASVLFTIAKAKSMAIKNKASAMKTRLIIFGLLQNKVSVSVISGKIHALLSQGKGGENNNGRGADNYNKPMVPFSAAKDEGPWNQGFTESLEDVEDHDYPADLTQSLFDLDDDDDVPVNDAGAVIDLVSKFREDGSNFNLEDEIDLVADVFIRSFHREMKLQTQDSVNRYQEMLVSDGV